MTQPELGGSPPPTCEYVMAWEPLAFCGTLARWRYPASGGGYMYLCDEHGIANLNHTEPVNVEV
jgi:hypothetical protein